MGRLKSRACVSPSYSAATIRSLASDLPSLTRSRSLSTDPSARKSAQRARRSEPKGAATGSVLKSSSKHLPDRVGVKVVNDLVLDIFGIAPKAPAPVVRDHALIVGLAPPQATSYERKRGGRLQRVRGDSGFNKKRRNCSDFPFPEICFEQKKLESAVAGPQQRIQRSAAALEGKSE